jgi:Uma2 family endonuclease
MISEAPVQKPLELSALDVTTLLSHDDPEQNFELIHGEKVLVVSDPVASRVTMHISHLISLFLDQNPLGELSGPDGGYVVGDDRYIPDIAFVTYDSLAAASNDGGYLTVAPQLVVEVLSPGNIPRHIRIKLNNYLREGTTVWIIDPRERNVEVYVPGRSAQVLQGEDKLTGEPVLPGFAVTVSQLWPRSLHEQTLQST